MKDDKVFAAHRLVLDLALRESFLRQTKSELLFNTFGEENIDSLFGQGSHDDQADGGGPANDKGMSFCFHQSEQSLLRYVVDSGGGKELHNEFTSFLINFTKYFLLNNIEAIRPSLSLIAGDSDLPPPSVADANDLPSLEDFTKDERGASSSSSSTSKAPAKANKLVKEFSVGIKQNVEIDLEVVSSRHICKYCRGSFYFCQNKILSRLEETLTRNGVCVNAKDREFGALHKHIIEHLKLENPPQGVRIKFLNAVSLKILASGRVQIEDKLIGKMEKSK